MRTTIVSLLTTIFVGTYGLYAADPDEFIRIEYGGWSIVFDRASRTLDYIREGETILGNVYVKAAFDGKTILSTGYPDVDFERAPHSDIFGDGERFTLRHSGAAGCPDICQDWCFYPDREWFLTEVRLESASTISTNYIAPVYTGSRSCFLPDDDSNRALRVPFDNDNFVGYLSSPLTIGDTSFEVTAIFNGRSRRGLVVGSVEHDTWKTGVSYTCTEGRYVDEFECFSGVIHQQTRDIANPSKQGQVSIGAHGSIRGTRLESAKMFFGLFDDWRRGLEAFGEANALVAPPRKWNNPTPFGWNSWAAMAERVNYQGAVEVADFIKKELQPRGFENGGVTYIGLDSFWDNFTEEQLRGFVDHCRANGQMAGIYWCPFSDWRGQADAFVEGTGERWRYRDIYLTSGGRPRKIESLAVDPTHPATKLRMEHFISKFKEWGFSYLKLDFINNGTLEADSFHNPAVTTGVQAYNEGMEYLSELCGDDMFLALSIAPVFPARWGSSRRISCDVWGAMGTGAGTTGYMLNSLSFGWWLDRVYPYNDADHILLHKPAEAADYQAGANRARVTSAVITGIYMLGDNFSLSGGVPGDVEARQKALVAVTNPAINDIARIGRSFYPVEGYTAATPDGAETMFTLATDEATWLAVFNFDGNAASEGIVALDRLDLDPRSEVDCEELWTGTQTSLSDGELSYSVPPQDVRVYKITRKTR